MFIVTPTPDARPSSFSSGMNGILHPTARQWWGRQREPMPLRCEVSNHSPQLQCSGFAEMRTIAGWAVFLN